MNQDQAKGKFEQVKGKIKETWGRLTDDDITLYDGKRQQFLGKLREKYGLMEADAESQLRRLEQAHKDAGESSDANKTDKPSEDSANRSSTNRDRAA